MLANLNNTVIYYGTLTLENIGTLENCYGIFITLTLGVNVIKQYCGKLLQ